MANLTEKQEKFVDSFTESMEQDFVRNAAKDAGYSESTVTHAETEILQSAGVKKALSNWILAVGFSSKVQLIKLAPFLIEKAIELLKDENLNDNAKVTLLKSMMDRIEEFQRKFGLDIEGQLEHEHSIDEADQELAERLLETAKSSIEKSED